jgi:hypothetical protein
VFYLSKLLTTSHFVPLFLAQGDVVVGIAIFHIELSTPRLGSFICLSFILHESWSYHCNLILKEKKKGTPPWYVNVGGHLMESVSHGLRKKKGGEECQSFIKSTNVPNFQRTRNHSHLFIMEDSKTPLLVVDMKQPPLKTQFLSLFYK